MCWAWDQLSGREAYEGAGAIYEAKLSLNWEEDTRGWTDNMDQAKGKDHAVSLGKGNEVWTPSLYK